MRESRQYIKDLIEIAVSALGALSRGGRAGGIASAGACISYLVYIYMFLSIHVLTNFNILIYHQIQISGNSWQQYTSGLRSQLQDAEVYLHLRVLSKIVSKNARGIITLKNSDETTRER